MYKHISSGLYFPGLNQKPPENAVDSFFLPEVQACLSPAVLPVVAVAVAHAVPL